MALTFSSTVPSDLNTIRGAARLDYWTYVTAGGDGSSTGTYLGQLADGGADFLRQIEYAFVEGEESFSPSDAYITGDKVEITATLLEVPIATYNLVFGGVSGNVTTTGVTSKQMAIGGYYTSATDTSPIFYQFGLRVFNEQAAAGAQLKGYYQIYKGLITGTGAIKFGKKNISSLGVKITALWDHSITAVAGGPGKLGKKYIALS